MPRVFHALVGLATALLLFCADAHAVHLRGQIIHVGFWATSRHNQGADHYRLGCYTPVLVELTNDDGDLFNGAIEIRQKDRDGDEIFDRLDNIAVRGTRRYHLYIPAGRFHDVNQYAVRVFNTDGSLAPLYNDGNEPISQLLPPRSLVEIPDEALVILCIDKGLTQLEKLIPQSMRDLYITNCSLNVLPDNVAGLEMADIIVWDRVDPSSIDLHQLDALIEWTRRGGTLVLGVSRNWELVSKSRLGNILPAKLGPAAGTRRVRELADTLFGYTDTDFDPPELSKPITYCPITQESLTSDALSVIPANPKPEDRLFVTSRPFGCGRVVLVSAEIIDLLEQGTQGTTFLRHMIGLRTVSEKKEDNQTFHGGDANIFRFVEGLFGFTVTAGIYLLFAFIFVSAYILLATLGNWSWLKRKGMIQHNWTTFAAATIVASGISLLAVQFIRGYGHRVQELAIVDARANSYEASATCYFGLKTASHTLLDLRVPSDWSQPEESPELAGNLRPFPPSSSFRFDTNVYAAGKEYQSVASLGELRSVPLRATLKQFEAHWHGQMNHQLKAELRRKNSNTSYLRGDSWIHNDLHTDLNNCYLLVPDRNIRLTRAIRSIQIFVYAIGPLKAGEKITINKIVEAILKQKAAQGPLKERQKLLDEMLDNVNEWTPPRLNEYHKEWLKRIGIRQNYQYRYGAGDDDKVRVETRNYDSALLLLTTYDDIDTDLFTNSWHDIGRSHGQRLDRSPFVNNHTALLVGFSEDPSPCRLCWRKPGAKSNKWKPIHPDESHVMYRIEIPIAP